MNYIIITEDGEALTCGVIPEDSCENIEAGILTVIRASDIKELMPSGAWVDLNTYEHE